MIKRKVICATCYCAMLFAWIGTLGCAGRMPVISGMTMNIVGNDHELQLSAAGYNTTLQIHWLGTACYLIQLGDKAIFTDPFLSHQSLFRSRFGRIRSNSALVKSKLATLQHPQAIFVTHSHYDHLLDAAECLKQPGWANVPIYGSETTSNILCGFGQQFAANCREVNTNGEWQSVAHGIRYKAFPAKHGRQLPVGPLLYPGEVRRPLASLPDRASDFKVGSTLAYVFEISNEQVQFKIYLAGAAHAAPQGFPDDEAIPVDVAILCVPTWRYSRGYPAEYVRKLKAATIVASHFDNFFQVSGNETEVVPLCDLDGFLRVTQSATSYPGFRRLIVPSVGAVIHCFKRIDSTNENKPAFPPKVR